MPKPRGDVEISSFNYDDDDDDDDDDGYCQEPKHVVVP